MIQHKRRDKIYVISLSCVTPRPGSDKTVYHYKVESNPAKISFNLFIHFPNALILKNRLTESSLNEILEKKAIEWLDQGIEETTNIYILPEDILQNPFRPSGISPA